MIKAIHLFKTYPDTGRTALRDVSFTLPNTGLVLLKGESGSGKSTLLSAISTLEEVDKGSITFNDKVITSFSKKEKQEYLKNDIAICFQDRNLVPYLTVEENILPYASNKDYLKTITYLGLTSLLKSKVMTLSGGEQERVSILRATLKKSKVLLLDEPANSLDEDNVDKVFTLLKNISKDKLVIISSHIPLPKSVTPDVTLNMEKGELLSYEVNNKDVFKTETKEEEQDFFPPKKVLITSFFKEVFRSLFHFKTRLITSIVILFLSLTAIFLSGSLYFRDEKTMIVSGLYNTSNLYLALRSESGKHFNEQDIQLTGTKSYENLDRSLYNNIFRKVNTARENFIAKYFLSIGKNVFAYEDVKKDIEIVLGKMPEGEEFIISESLYNFFKDSGYKNETVRYPVGSVDETFLNGAATIKVEIQNGVSKDLKIVGVFKDDNLDYFSALEDKEALKDYETNILNSVLLSTFSSALITSKAALDGLTLRMGDSFTLSNDFVLEVDGNVFRPSVSLLNDEDNLKSGEGIALPYDNFVQYYNSPLILPEEAQIDINNLSLGASLDELPLGSSSLLLKETNLSKLSLLAAVIHVKKNGLPPNLSTYKEYLFYTLPEEDKYILDNDKLLQTCYAVQLAFSNSYSLNSFFFENPFGDLPGASITLSFLKELLDPSLFPSVNFGVLKSGAKEKEYHLPLVSLTFSDTISLTSVYFNDLNDTFNPVSLTSSYFVDKRVNDVNDVLSHVEQYNAAHVEDPLKIESPVNAAVDSLFETYLTSGLLTLVFSLGVLFLIIGLLFFINIAFVTFSLTKEEDAIKLSLGVKKSYLYFRNFVGQFLLFIFPFLLSTVVALIVFNLLNQFISGYFLVTLPYLALHGFLTGMLFLLILLLISSLVFLALINSDKKIQRTLKAAFH